MYQVLEGGQEELVIARSSSFLRKMIMPLRSTYLNWRTAEQTIVAESGSFVISKSCEAQSGDYTLMAKQGNYLIACLGDAMGHGEEAHCLAAEMKRVLGIALRNVLSESPGYLVKYCNFLFRLNNSQGRNFSSKTSDLCICEVDLEKQILRYSSARINMILVRKGKAVRLKKDRFAIGAAEESKFNVSSYTLKLEKGDRLFLYSDGITDQFGGPKNKKLGNKGLERLLESIVSANPDDISAEISRELDQWKSGVEQIDDMTMIGITI